MTDWQNFNMFTQPPRQTGWVERKLNPQVGRIKWKLPRQTGSSESERQDQVKVNDRIKWKGKWKAESSESERQAKVKVNDRIKWKWKWTAGSSESERQDGSSESTASAEPKPLPALVTHTTWKCENYKYEKKPLSYLCAYWMRPVLPSWT